MLVSAKKSNKTGRRQGELHSYVERNVARRNRISSRAPAGPKGKKGNGEREKKLGRGALVERARER